MADFSVGNNTPIHRNAGHHDAPAAKPKLERSPGGRLDVPEGLSARTSIAGGGSAPRQSISLTRSHGGRLQVPDGLGGADPARPMLTRSLGGRLEVPSHLIEEVADPKPDMASGPDRVAASAASPSAAASSEGPEPPAPTEPSATPEPPVDGPGLAEPVHASSEELQADAETMDAIEALNQASANAEALAAAQADAVTRQAFLELQKQLAEMQAKSVESMGEMLKGLA